LNLPDDIDRLVQLVYGNTPAPTGDDAELSSALNTAEIEYLNQRTLQAGKAQQAALPPPDDWGQSLLPMQTSDDDAVDGVGLVGTRLGQPSVSVVPLYRLEDRWSLDPGGRVSWRVDERVPYALAPAIAQRQVRLSRWQLTKDSAWGVKPLGWDQNSLLVHLRPLELDHSGLGRAGSLTIRLDPESGIVYGSAQGAAA
jgi:CRISPR-associated endonuclease/helicase Cas3